MKKKIYLTTPIFYPNDFLHLGHAYTLTVADVIARFKILDGYQVTLQTGSDEHGEKMLKTAISRGLTPIELVDSNVEKFKTLFRKMNVISDYYFMRTSYSFHEEEVKKIFLSILKNGDIYEGFYEGNYCINCEEYSLLDDVCDFCSSKLVRVSEKCFFLKVEKYRKFLTDCYEKQKIKVLPKSSLHEILESFLSSEMPDLSITRRKLEWGIRVPGNSDLTFYVWFEALCNYMTSPHGKEFFHEQESIATNNGKKIEEFEEEPKTEIVQIIGKDIARFHLVYWPIILSSLKKRLPDRILSHGWILQSGLKMSKSKGNAVDPVYIIDKYGSDSLRSFFCSKVNFLSDGVFSEESISRFYNDFFVNNLGNLFSRTRAMNEKYFSSKFPFSSSPFPNKDVDFSSLKSHERFSLIEKEVQLYRENMNSFQITKAFANIDRIISESNKFITYFSPWEIFNKGDNFLLSEVMVCLVNFIKIISFLILPFAPDCGEAIIVGIGLRVDDINFSNLLSFSSVEKANFRKYENHLFKRI